MSHIFKDKWHCCFQENTLRFADSEIDFLVNSSLEGTEPISGGLAKTSLLSDNIFHHSIHMVVFGLSQEVDCLSYDSDNFTLISYF